MFRRFKDAKFPKHRRPVDNRWSVAMCQVMFRPMEYFVVINAIFFVGALYGKGLGT